MRILVTGGAGFIGSMEITISAEKAAGLGNPALHEKPTIRHRRAGISLRAHIPIPAEIGKMTAKRPLTFIRSFV